MHHEPDDPLERGVEPGIGKCGAMRFAGLGHRLCRRHVERRDGMRRATRRRYFRANDVARRDTRGGCLLLGHSGEPGGPQRDVFVGERDGFTRAAHRAIEMNLAEAGVDIGRHHRLGMTHRLIGGQRLPGIGAEVIATEDHPVHAQANCVGDTGDEGTKIPRRHAGIAASLVDLVARCFDQHHSAIALPARQRGLDHQRVRRAHRGNAAKSCTRPADEAAKRCGAIAFEPHVSFTTLVR